MRGTRVRALGVGAVAAMLLASCSLVDGAEGYRVTAYFDRAVALYEESQVKVLGLPAGRITDIEVEGDRVRVEMRIDDDVPVPVDARAAIVPQSLIGERFVQLVPAWTTGTPTLEDGAVIPLERTRVPVEPDEALAALKEFLDTLDPEAAGRLVTNAADSLEGNGAALGRALTGLADLNTTLAEKDEVLARIVDQLDDFAATLVTREAELGQVLDLFATTTSALAEERRAIEGLVGNLAQASTAGLDLVSRHRAELERDVEILTRTMRTVEANLETVDDLLASSDDFPAGLADAFDEEHRRIDLRNQFSPLVTDILDTVPGLGRGVCLPIDVRCEPAPVDPAGSATPASVDGDADSPPAPAVRGASHRLRPVAPAGDGGPGGGVAEQVAAGLGATGRFLRTAAATLLGAGG